MPYNTLDVLENNLLLALDQIKLLKFIKNSEFPSTNDSFRSQFLELLEQKASVYTKSLETKRKIPCDLLSELERFQREENLKCQSEQPDKKRRISVSRLISGGEGNEENLLSNVSNLFEEIANIVD